MRARTLLLLVLAVVLAGGTAMLARSWLAAERTKEIKEAAPMALQTPSRSVLVARADIKRGQILRAEELVWQIWPEGALDKNYVVLGGPKTPESYAGWVAKNPIAGGEPVTEAKIVAPGSRGFLSAVLRPGMRAISVPVTLTSGISGFIFPGDQVDLLLTYSVQAPPKANQVWQYEGHRAAQTLLHNVRVIAIDQRLESKPGEAVVAHTVTFEVTPKQTEVIAVAQELPGAKLSLSLRSLVPDPGAAAEKTQASAEDPAAMSVRTAAASERVVSLAQANVAAARGNAVASDRDGSTGNSALPITLAQAQTAAGASGAAAPAAAPSGGPRVVTPAAIGTDTSVAQKATYTIDNEISSILPPLKPEGEASELFICKGPALNCVASQGRVDANAAELNALKMLRQMENQILSGGR